MCGDMRDSLQSNQAGIRKAEEEALILKRQQKEDQVQGFWKAVTMTVSKKKQKTPSSAAENLVRAELLIPTLRQVKTARP